MAYTAVPTVTTGDLWTAANHNTYIKDNFANHETRIGAMETATKTVKNSYMWLKTSGTWGLNGVTMADATDEYAYAIFEMPNDYDSGTPTIGAVVYSAASGNMYCALTAYYGVFSSTQSISAVAYTAGTFPAIIEIGIPSVAAGNLVRVEFQRDSTDVLDTINAASKNVYLRLTYTAANFE